MKVIGTIGTHTSAYFYLNLQFCRVASVFSMNKCDFLSGINSLNLCPACLVTLSRGLDFHKDTLNKVQCCYELQCPLSQLRLESDPKL